MGYTCITCYTISEIITLLKCIVLAYILKYTRLFLTQLICCQNYIYANKTLVASRDDKSHKSYDKSTQHRAAVRVTPIQEVNFASGTLARSQ